MRRRGPRSPTGGAAGRGPAAPNPANAPATEGAAGEEGTADSWTQDTGPTTSSCHRATGATRGSSPARRPVLTRLSPRVSRLRPTRLHRTRRGHAHLRLPGPHRLARRVGARTAPDVLRPVRVPRRRADRSPWLAARGPARRSRRRRLATPGRACVLNPRRRREATPPRSVGRRLRTATRGCVACPACPTPIATPR